jgi:tetratricopeptide (TPR) repeat protein
MDLLAQLSEGQTLAEIQGIPPEMGEAIADIADGELEAGRAACARAILEGLVVTNPRDARAWTLLARVHRRLGHHLAARLCAEVAASLAPTDPVARLGRAEALLSFPDDRETARAELRALEGEGGVVGNRARALRTALGE